MKFLPHLILVLVCLSPLIVAADPVAPQPGTILDSSSRNEEWFKKNCVKVQDQYVPEITRTCSVNAFAPLGRVAGAELYFALYRHLQFMHGKSIDIHDQSIFDKAPYNNTVVVVFQRAGKWKMRPVLAEIISGSLGEEWFETPGVVVQEGKEMIKIKRGVYRRATEKHFYTLTKGVWSTNASLGGK